VTLAQTGYALSPMGRMGEPPGGILDYLIVGAAIIAVIVSAVFMIRRLVRPGEQAPDHIKRIILDDASARPTADRRSSP
jgi:hypothetical protein